MKRVYKILTKLHKTAGIYIISCIETDKVYIGESLNVSRRILKHFTNLRKNMHHNPILQAIFNKYGEETMIVDVLEWVNSDDINQLDFLLRKKEIEYQKKFEHCINFDKNGHAWKLNATEEQKEANRKQLDSIREAAMNACKTSLVIYNIKTKEKIEVDSLQEAENYIEQKHIYRNIKDKVYLPYNNYVAFLPEEYNPTLILNTSCTSNSSISEVYKLYNLKT